jgi:hypothetical protein
MVVAKAPLSDAKIAGLSLLRDPIRGFWMMVDVDPKVIG